MDELQPRTLRFCGCSSPVTDRLDTPEPITTSTPLVPPSTTEPTTTPPSTIEPTPTPSLVTSPDPEVELPLPESDYLCMPCGPEATVANEDNIIPLSNGATSCSSFVDAGLKGVFPEDFCLNYISPLVKEYCGCLVLSTDSEEGSDNDPKDAPLPTIEPTAPLSTANPSAPPSIAETTASPSTTEPTVPPSIAEPTASPSTIEPTATPPATIEPTPTPSLVTSPDPEVELPLPESDYLCMPCGPEATVANEDNIIPLSNGATSCSSFVDAGLQGVFPEDFCLNYISPLVKEYCGCLVLSTDSEEGSDNDSTDGNRKLGLPSIDHDIRGEARSATNSPHDHLAEEDGVGQPDDNETDLSATNKSLNDLSSDTTATTRMVTNIRTGGLVLVLMMLLSWY
jgi:hypothetical protein